MSSTTLPRARSRRPRRPVLLVGALVVALALGAGVAYAVASNGISSPAGPADAVAVPVVAPVGLNASGRVPWDKPLALSVTDGTLRAVSALDPDGKRVDGTLLPDSWQSTQTLLPDASYRILAVVADRRGAMQSMSVTALTTPAAKVLRAVLSPGDDNLVGVGMTVILTLNRAVDSPADRAAIEARLSVRATPEVAGGWRWMSPSELHYRGPEFWAAGSQIVARADFRRLMLSDGTWGFGVRETHFSIGRRVVSTVDVTKHVMAVVQDGVLLRTLKVSTGRDKYPTKGGVHLVLEKTKLKIMDSATVGIPRKSPDGYYEKVPNSVRISYGGAFVHSAGWSVRDQGIRNVSHGCINISPADSEWFYDLVRRGDVVDVIHAAAPPLLSDPGMSDWNISFADWAN